MALAAQYGHWTPLRTLELGVDCVNPGSPTTLEGGKAGSDIIPGDGIIGNGNMAAGAGR